MNVTDEVKAKEDLERALGSGQPDAIARAVIWNIWPLFSAHYDLLISAVVSLPSSVLERYPAIRLLHPLTPVLARTTRPFKPLVYPDDARTMSADELDMLTLVQLIAFRFSGDVAASLIYARRLEDRILQVPNETRERADGPLWYFHHQIGSTLLAAGDSSRALLEFATARQLGKHSPQPDAERLALGRTALAHAVRGSLEDADVALTEATHQPPPTAAHVNSCLMTERTAAALIAVERMDDDIDDVLAGLDPYDSIEMAWPFALLARARALLVRRRAADALETIRLANDAHPAQHGSFASDVISSTSIEAFCALGDIPGARRIAEENTRAGVFTSAATVRLDIHEGRFDQAEHGVRRILADRTIGPGQRAKAVLLSAWLEVARTGSLDRETALRIARRAETRNYRRLLATLPLQVIDSVRVHLTTDEARRFDENTAGLMHAEARSRPTLTGGELRVLNALLEHGTTAEIASAFHVSPNTIKSQLKSLYRKLGCATRGDALKTAARFHLLTSEKNENRA
ncbi:hypothetical protein F6J84_01550 [Microbacterium caowuchunii]|uniref:helix-turn-helix domain-containing protein n=1 Tax=Microbacterium caowuchunii TaxID=2614638 RepID=UPI001243DF03|nr:helix-turn-helix transcriptional regulator [Microbacterium caowuchunii]QEV98931.1 hypothetical protein F6J84_01550 [Microbacterium caowuchunii]